MPPNKQNTDVRTSSNFFSKNAKSSPKCNGC